MMEQCENSLLGSIAKSLTTVEGVDTYLGWDPEKNVDTGWLMLKRGTKIDFSNMQLRDVNLCDVEEEKYSDDEANKSFSSDITISTYSDEIEDGMIVYDDFMLDDENDLNDQSLRIGMTGGVNAGPKSLEKEPLLNKSKILQTEDISRGSPNNHLPVNSNLKSSKCNFCLVDVDDLISHMSKCLIKNAVPTERVSCPGCSKLILRKGLTTHLKVSCRRKSVTSTSNNLNSKGSSQCTHCGVFIKDDSEHHAVCILRPSAKEVNIEENTCHGQCEKLNDSNDSRSSCPGYDGDIELSNDAVVEKFSMEVDESSPKYMSKAYCRLKFTLENGKVMKKIFKSSMIKSVQGTMNKFASFVGVNPSDLVFESNGYPLSGEELAASIDKGKIYVRIKNNSTITEGADIELPDTNDNEPDMQVSQIGLATEENDLHCREREIEFSMF